MAVFNAANVKTTDVVNQAQTALVGLRQAFAVVQNLYAWTSGLSLADLETLGLSAADAQTLQSAVADANALAQIYDTGLPPGSYPQPASAYVYASSQRQVIGPR
jgi:hypothetical protein